MQHHVPVRHLGRLLHLGICRPVHHVKYIVCYPQALPGVLMPIFAAPSSTAPMPERGRTCGHPLGPARRWRDLHRRVPRLHGERDRALGSGAAPEPGHRRSPSGCPRLVGCLASPGGNVTGLGAVSGPRRGRRRQPPRVAAPPWRNRVAGRAPGRGHRRAPSGPPLRRTPRGKFQTAETQIA